jgi:hypothetical protein
LDEDEQVRGARDCCGCATQLGAVQRVVEGIQELDGWVDWGWWTDTACCCCSGVRIAGMSLLGVNVGHSKPRAL